MKNYQLYKVLTIAGFDGSGGAGIQADLKTFSALGCYAATALTALPVQNTMEVRSIYEIDTDLFRRANKGHIRRYAYECHQDRHATSTRNYRICRRYFKTL